MTVRTICVSIWFALSSGCGASPPSLDTPPVNTTATTPVCGNGVLEPGERCDGRALGVHSCTALGFAGGVLACREDCDLDLSRCSRDQDSRPNPDADADSDGIPDADDRCPTIAYASQLDTDTDGVGDDCDNCPLDANSDQTDTDRDGVGDVCAGTPPGPDPDPDPSALELEPNDDGALQTLVLGPASPAATISATSTPVTNQHGYAGNDVDVFRLEVAAAGAVTVEIASSTADVDLFVSGDATLAAESSASAESLTTTVTGAAVLGIAVKVWSGTAGPYTLTVTWTATSPEDPPTGDDEPPAGDEPAAPNWYGCWEVWDNLTCADLCASIGGSCSTGCGGGIVSKIYTLLGPCDYSQPTRFGSGSCDDVLDIGTSGALYVQCCCE